MVDSKLIENVLSAYPKDYRSEDVFAIDHPAGLSGAEYWKIDAPAGPLCLRRWPAGLPTLDHLQYTQAVLWYLVFEGFNIVPLPCETSDNKGFIFCEGHYWELLPWMGGTKDMPNSLNGEVSNPDSEGADFAESAEKTVSSVQAEFSNDRVEPSRIVSAMLTLAQFHEITSTFPLPNEAYGISFRVQRNQFLWKEWAKDRLVSLTEQLRIQKRSARTFLEMELILEGQSLIESFLSTGSGGMMMFVRGSQISVPIQTTVGNADRRHLLFDSEGVCGMIDFKEMGADSVALDIASLLGSLAGNDPKLWTYGLKAYKSIRSLSEEELYLTMILDFGEMILSGLEWLDKIYLKQVPLSREQLLAILGRLRWRTARLKNLRFDQSSFVA